MNKRTLSADPNPPALAELPSQPCLQEMRVMVKHAAPCLNCVSAACITYMPDGIEVCSGVQYWRGQPVSRAMLLYWQQLVAEADARRQKKHRWF